MSHRGLLLLAGLAWLLSQTSGAAPLPATAIPDALKPWQNWVLWPERNLGCPALTDHAGMRPCVWPGRLRLDLDGRGGRFELALAVYAEQQVALPGDTVHWPQAATANGRPLPVVERDGLPYASLPPGTHYLSGRFRWDRLPPTLALPAGSALIDLKVHGRPVDFPTLNEQGQLWLAPAADEPPAAASDTLHVAVFRRLDDGVPVRVLTHVDLDVAGKSREIALAGALLPQAVAMRLDSPLPARLEPDGTLRLQVRPGRWSLELLARYPGGITEFPRAAAGEAWPAEEIWSYRADRAVRLAEVADAATVDPRQTQLPEDWRDLPAYRLEAGTVLRLNVLRRGDPEPEPDRLTLSRSLWLDFDGGGYTVADHIGGQMTRDWRLNAGAGLRLGQVLLNGEPQPITLDPAGGEHGVEVRRGDLDLHADSRLPAGQTLSATGWRKDFRSLRAELNLPPGWRLVTAWGVDEAPGAWMTAWTLLDFFVVLTLGLAAGKLWDWRAGLLTLLTLTLIWQEPGAPRFAWVNLLAVAGLLRVLPATAAGGARAATMRRWVQGYRLLAVVVLALIAIPFLGQQLRLGLYPALEHPYGAPGLATPEVARAQAAGEVASALAENRDESMPDSPPAAPAMKAAGPTAPAPEPVALGVDRIDPDALTQTGPGRPAWTWNRIALVWKGPVQQDQNLTLVLVSPAMNLFLNGLRVLLLAALAALLIRGDAPWPRFRLRAGQTAGLLLLMLFLPRPHAAELPTPELLNELRNRLTAPPACAPRCADIPRMTVSTGPRTLNLQLDIDVAAPVGVPLPAQPGWWLPSQVQVDGKPATALLRDEEGRLWLALEPGRHRVALGGGLPAQDQVVLPLPLRPHRIETAGSGWRIEGVGEHGVPEVQLRLLRITGETPSSLPALAAGEPLPAFLEVERTLALGLDWRVVTRVRRLTPPDSAVTLEIPLLPGESVLTADLPAAGGHVRFSLPAGETEGGWTSSLARQATLTLAAPDTGRWSEVWRLAIGPRWHVASSGIAVVHHRAPDGHWQPEWRPWPGEQVTLAITQPAGAPGETLTIDGSELRLRPGERATQASLSLNFHSSQGGQLPVTLPPGAQLQAVAIDGLAQPIRQDGRTVRLPVHPGRQTARLDWASQDGIRTVFPVPDIRLGQPSVNATVHVEMSPDRWIWLLGGPRMGPAVLFWSVLALLVLLAFGLSRLPHSPARFGEWALLLVGLSQASVSGGLAVVGWLLALAWRERTPLPAGSRTLRLTQTGLILWSLVALATLTGAVAEGLLGLPAMQIAGNQSQAQDLVWYLDRSPETLPRPWVLSVPLWVYRGLMLAWALWLANTLLKWLRWGWNCLMGDPIATAEP